MTILKPTRRDLLKIMATAPFALAIPTQAAEKSDFADTAPRTQLLKDKPADAHRILTCNILLDLPEHKGDMSWEKRRGDVCIQIIKNRRPDIFGLQEVGHGQYADFQRAFPDMASHGFVGAVSDAHLKRFQQIRNVIFYSKKRYELTSAGGYVLSETPYLPRSRYPDENLGRHVNWVRLRDRDSGTEFRVLDTHLSLKHPTRIKETTLIAAETSQYSPAFPQLLCGDFNSRLGSEEITNLINAGWNDTYHGAGTTPESVSRYMEKRKIDFIFRRGSVTTLAAEYIEDRIDGDRPSDHNFFGADVKLG